MIHHIRRRRIEFFQCNFQPAAKIRRQDFDFGNRGHFAHDTNAIGEMLRPAVAQIIPVHAGNDDIFQSHGGDGFRQMAWLILIRWQGLAMPHIAERTAARA